MQAAQPEPPAHPPIPWKPLQDPPAVTPPARAVTRGLAVTPALQLPWRRPHEQPPRALQEMVPWVPPLRKRACPYWVHAAAANVKCFFFFFYILFTR